MTPTMEYTQYLLGRKIYLSWEWLTSLMEQSRSCFFLNHNYKLCHTVEPHLSGLFTYLDYSLTRPHVSEPIPIPQQKVTHSQSGNGGVRIKWGSTVYKNIIFVLNSKPLSFQPIIIFKKVDGSIHLIILLLFLMICYMQTW